VTVRLIFAVCVGLAAAIQAIVTVCFGFWAPAAVIWETFGVHYTLLPTLEIGYHFVGNAESFTTIYAYLPSYIAHHILTGSQFDRYQSYLLMVYATQGILVGCVAWWVWSQPLRFSSKVLVVSIGAILPLWFGAAYINMFSPNYFWFAAAVAPVAIVMCVRAVKDGSPVGSGLAFGLGAIVAAGVLAKFTYAITLAPFFLFPTLVKPRARSLIAFVAGGGIGAASIAYVYFVGNADYASRFVDGIQAMYVQDYLYQRTDFLWDQLTNWKSLTPVHLAGALLVATSILATTKLTNIRAVIVYAMLAIVAALFVQFIEVRTSGNTFMDAILFASFAIAVWLAIFLENGKIAPVAIVAGCYVAIVFWQTFGVMRLPTWIKQLEQAGASARTIQDDIDRRHLPVVYYWPGGHGIFWSATSPVWPSPYLYALLSGNQETKQKYLDRYFPRSIARGIEDGPAPYDHVMVLQNQDGRDRRLAALVDRSSCREFVSTNAWTEFPPPPGEQKVTICSAIGSAHASSNSAQN
jgi:hypothetical protein